MKKLVISISLFLFLLACSKDKSLSISEQTCGPDPNLEGTWIGDSMRTIYTDSNGVVLLDASGPFSYPQNYFRLQLFCNNNVPTLFGDYFQNSSYNISHDSSTYYLYGNTIYYSIAGTTDTSLMGKKHIEYLSGNILHLRWSYIDPVSLQQNDEYYYMKK